MLKGIRVAIMLAAGVAACRSGMGADEDARRMLLGELKSNGPRLRAGGRDTMIRGEFRNVTDRKGYVFRLMAGASGDTFIERTIESQSETDSAGKSIALITPSEAVHLVQENPGQQPRVWKYRPDGLGSYARLSAAMRDDLAAASDACWSIHGTDVIDLLADRRVVVLDTRRVVTDGVPIVIVRFDSSAAPYHFDRGELHFRPDRSWAMSKVNLDFPSTHTTGVEHRVARIVRSDIWHDGAIFPVEVETTVEYTNRHDRLMTHVAFLDRSSAFERDRLFDEEIWTNELALRAVADDGGQEFAMELPVGNSPPVAVSKNAERFMKYASPASGVLAAIFLASLFDRFRTGAARKRTGQYGYQPPSSLTGRIWSEH